MNKNTRRKSERAHDAFARIKQADAKGRLANQDDYALSATVGRRDPLDKNPKVARSAADYSRRNTR